MHSGWWGLQSSWPGDVCTSLVVCDAAALAACVGCLVVTTAHGMQLLSNLSKSSKHASTCGTKAIVRTRLDGGGGGDVRSAGYWRHRHGEFILCYVMFLLYVVGQLLVVPSWGKCTVFGGGLQSSLCGWMRTVFLAITAAAA